MTTETSFVTNTTRGDEENTAESDANANESQRSATHAQPRPETGTAFLLAAAFGAFTINWK
ncbi:MAG TPA: hypothetical protein VH591_12895 [Ktedonobacterales bacterium]|jgi:hypothetical protein